MQRRLKGDFGPSAKHAKTNEAGGTSKQPAGQKPASSKSALAQGRRGRSKAGAAAQHREEEEEEEEVASESESDS
jgi:hypothetical protein